MSTSVRLDDKLVKAAELEAANHKRTPPKQIEYWADIGRSVSHQASSSDLLALMQGVARIKVVPPTSVTVAPSSVFHKLEQDRKNGVLSSTVPNARYRFEACQSKPGLLDRVAEDGSRQTGAFENGEFVAVK